MFVVFAELIEADAHLVFEDVIDEFCTVKSVLRHFEKWRSTDWESYTEAYVSLCIPKVLSPLLRVQMLMWNPLLVSECGKYLSLVELFNNILKHGFSFFFSRMRKVD